MCLYEVGPLPDDHNVRLVHELQLSSQTQLCRSCNVFGDLVVIEISERIAVWDYVRGLFRSWRVGMPSEFTRQVSFVDPFLD